jgi:hypothetical protein
LRSRSKVTRTESINLSNNTTTFYRIIPRFSHPKSTPNTVQPTNWAKYPTAADFGLLHTSSTVWDLGKKLLTEWSNFQQKR